MSPRVNEIQGVILPPLERPFSAFWVQSLKQASLKKEKNLIRPGPPEGRLTPGEIEQLQGQFLAVAKFHS